MEVLEELRHKLGNGVGRTSSAWTDINSDRMHPRHALSTISSFFEGEPLGSLVARATDGRGAQVIFDAVGGPMFEPGLKALGHYGRQVEIASVGNRRVSFDLLDFYHNESRLFGVDTRHRDATASAALLEALTPFFDDGAIPGRR